jgi:hypothetical protein
VITKGDEAQLTPTLLNWAEKSAPLPVRFSNVIAIASTGGALPFFLQTFFRHAWQLTAHKLKQNDVGRTSTLSICRHAPKS